MLSGMLIENTLHFTTFWQRWLLSRGPLTSFQEVACYILTHSSKQNGFFSGFKEIFGSMASIRKHPESFGPYFSASFNFHVALAHGSDCSESESESFSWEVCSCQGMGFDWSQSVTDKL